MRVIFRLMVAAAVLLTVRIEPAQATTGLLMWCSSARSCGMSGAGIALHSAADAALANPAGVARSDNSVHIGVGWMAWMPMTVDYNDENGIGLVNDTPKQSSAKDMYAEGTMAITYRLSDDWVVGLAGGGTGGIGGKYREPRFKDAANGDILGDRNYDTNTSLGIMSFYPTIAWTPSDTLALGASMIVSHATLKSDSAVFRDANGDGLPEDADFDGDLDIVQTAGHQERDHAHGAGFRAGFIWDINKKWSIGGAAQTPTWFEEFKEYEDLLIGPINVPAYTQLGVVWRGSDKFLIALDFRYQFYRFVKILNTTPDNGGFGWDDAKEVMLGGTYFLNPSLELRAGGSWSPNIIEKNEIFANALSPLVDTWRFDAGFGYGIGGKHTSKGHLGHKHHLDFDAYFVVPGDRREDGTGGFVSQIGKGTTHGHDMAGLRFGYHYQY